MSLNLYTALVKKDTNDKIEDISLSRSDFSFAAFFFSIFWFLSHTMWRESLLFVIVEIALFKLFANDFLTFAETLFLQIGLYVYIGMNARNLYSRHLQKNKGYKKLGYFLAQNEEEARLKSMKSWHRNSPDLSFDEISHEIIDPESYLKSVKPEKSFKKFLKRWQQGKLW